MNENKQHIIAGVIVCVVAILAIVTVEMYALSRGMDGVGLATSVALIAAIGAGFAGIKLKDVIFK